MLSTVTGKNKFYEELPKGYRIMTRNIDFISFGHYR